MIRRKKILAIIPARGGSKGIPDKNIKELHGQPLIYWTIIAAQQSQYIDKLICSTDSEEIASIAKRFGCSVPDLRDPSLAQDESRSIEVVLSILQTHSDYEYVLLLQPTSPLRTTADIDAAIEKCITNCAISCVSVSVTKENPAWMFTLEAERLRPIIISNATRRQDLPLFYQLNGAIYMAKTAWLTHVNTFLHEQTIPFIMPPERSIDIDEINDWVVAEHLLQQRANDNLHNRDGYVE